MALVKRGEMTPTEGHFERCLKRHSTNLEPTHWIMACKEANSKRIFAVCNIVTAADKSLSLLFKAARCWYLLLVTLVMNEKSEIYFIRRRIV